MRNAWDRAARHVLRDENLARDNARELYEKARVRFWREVRDDAVARRQFEDAGFDFPPSRGSAPMLRDVRPDVPDQEIRISLDHVSELAQGQNWRRALDADNLEFEFQMPNTFREIVQMRHSNLRQ